jgi:hypothetical protein
MDLKGPGYESAHWIHLTQARDQWRTPVNMEMNLQVPLETPFSIIKK